MRFHSSDSAFHWPFTDFSVAFWRRYPNPFAKHVLSEDVLYRYVSDGVIRTKRLLTKTNRMPKWGERISSARSVPIVEESIYDRKAETLTTYTKNLAFTRMLAIDEKCTYSIHPENKGLTVVKRQAWIDSHVGPGLSYAVQKFAVERFKHNCVNSNRGFVLKLTDMFGAPNDGSSAGCDSDVDAKGKKKLDQIKQGLEKLKHAKKAAPITEINSSTSTTE